jgi:drug/metabolite transporter superfamily protein YnfA
MNPNIQSWPTPEMFIKTGGFFLFVPLAASKPAASPSMPASYSLVVSTGMIPLTQSVTETENGAYLLTASSGSIIGALTQTVTEPENAGYKLAASGGVFPVSQSITEAENAGYSLAASGGVFPVSQSITEAENAGYSLTASSKV